MSVTNEDWVTLEAAAHAVDVDPTTLLEWCRAGTIPSYRDRQSPHQRFVRIDVLRQHVHDVRGRPQTSLQRLIASAAATQPGPSSEARISQLQSLIRERVLVS